MYRISGRLVAFVAAAILVSGSWAQAGVIGSATLSRSLPGSPFTTDTGYNVQPGLGDVWESYVLSVSTDDGTNISVVDVTITGVMNQRWAIDPDEGFVTPNPTASASLASAITTADSHLLLPANPVIFSSPTENNNQVAPFPTAPDTATRDYGIGTLLRGAWGYTQAETATSLNIAYIVIPKGTLPELNIHVEVDTDPNQDPPLAILGLCDFIDCGPGGTAPDVEDFIHPQMDGSADANPMSIMHTFTQLGGTDPIVWDGFMLHSYTPNYSGVGTGPLLDATFDPETQKFTWNPIGSPRGDYVWKVTASNSAGEDTGFLTVQIKNVPEPTTLGLIGLGLIGLVGIARRRS